jgi:hypothetical protein
MVASWTSSREVTRRSEVADPWVGWFSTVAAGFVAVSTCTGAFVAVGDVDPPVRLQAIDTTIVKITIKTIGRKTGLLILFLLIFFV